MLTWVRCDLPASTVKSTGIRITDFNGYMTKYDTYELSRSICVLFNHSHIFLESYKKELCLLYMQTLPHREPFIEQFGERIDNPLIAFIVFWRDFILGMCVKASTSVSHMNIHCSIHKKPVVVIDTRDPTRQDCKEPELMIENVPETSR